MSKVTIIEPTKQLKAQTVVDEDKRLRVAAYARVSTEQEEQQNSYETQVSYYTEHIKNNPDWEFVDVFADEGISGTSTKARVSFNQMIAKALTGEIDLIITKSISRFARNTVDTLQIVRELKSVGVEVYFEKENIHTLDPKSEIMLTILSSLAQEESRSISENIRWAQQKRREAGEITLAYGRFLGYKKGEDGRPEIVEEEAKVVRKIYELFLEDYTFSGIANYLTEQDIPTPTGKKVWTTTTVRSILSNEKYRGDALLQKTYTVDYLTKEVRKNNGEKPKYHVRDSHPAIIEPEVFDSVQEKLIKRKRINNKIRTSKDPFACKLICSDCGGFYGRKTWHKRDNTSYYVWHCNSRYKGDYKCNSPVLNRSEIESCFVKVLMRLGDEELKFSEKKWRNLVERVTVSSERKLKFELKDGKSITVKI